MNNDESRDCIVELVGVEAKALASDIGARTRHRRPDRRNYDIEIIEGDDWTADKGRFSWKKRIIDKVNDSYLEIVVDKETGEILHLCSEPWSDHVGHGSAKYGKSRD